MKSAVPSVETGFFKVMEILYDADKPMTANQIDDVVLEKHDDDLSDSYTRVAILMLRKRGFVKLVHTKTSCCPECGTKRYKKYDLTPDGCEAVRKHKR